MGRLEHLIVASLLAFVGSAQAATQVQVVGLFPGAAVLNVDGLRKLVKVGQTGPGGVQVISADSRGAVLRVDGVERSYSLSREYSNGFAEAQKKQLSVAKGIGGHYWVAGSVNSQPIQFLVDTGATLAFDATGGVHLFIKEQSAADEYETELRHLRIEPEPVLAITDLGLEPDPGPMPSAIHALGVYLMSDSSAVLVPTEDDQLFGFAGGLQGFKDNASPLEAEFAAYTLQLLPAADGSVRVLDYDPESRRMVMRHIAPAPGTSQP